MYETAIPKNLKDKQHNTKLKSQRQERNPRNFQGILLSGWCGELNPSTPHYTIRTHNKIRLDSHLFCVLKQLPYYS